MKIFTIVGARPQFIKAATVSRAIAEHNRLTTNHRSLITELIVHTGQHCITLRDETEWLETVEAGWNIVVKSDKERIVQAVFEKYWPTSQEPLFGDGQAAQQIVEILTNHDEK